MARAAFTNFRKFTRSFCEDTHGSMTVLGLFLFLASGIMGAIALDVTSLYSQRTHLQVAADQAAHAALYNRVVVGKDEAEAKVLAISLVEATLPSATKGVTIDADDIQFGVYSGSPGVFTADDDAKGAVRVVTSFSNLRSNPASTFLFRLIGIDDFEIYATSTFAVYNPTCLTEGFVANGIVDMQNQNIFGAGMCVHSNSEVQLQTNNRFELGSIVSMPGGADSVVVPDDKIQDVYGLQAALKDDKFDTRIFSRIENMTYQYQNPNGVDLPHPEVAGDKIDWPSYISDKTVQDMGKVSDIDSTSLPAGGVYFVDCTNQNTGLTINSGNGGSSVTVEDVLEISTSNGNGKDGGGSSEPLPVLSQVIVITPCPVTLGQGSSLQNARIISLSNDSVSFKAASGLSLGAIGLDGCETDGAQLISKGGMQFAADFSAYGSQMIAMGDIKFAATPSQPNDFKGVSMVSNSTIDVASHVNAEQGCTPGGGDQIKASYFRMVQ